MIVAIDGPAGSGKTTTARRVAARLGWLYLDTGAMYRAVALAFLDRGRPITAEAADEVLDDLRLDLKRDDDGVRVLLDGRDVTGRIRTAAVSDAASRVSALPAVRDRMLAEQRRVAREHEGSGVVVEGRDIGTVVFPGAELKVFMVADEGARAARRHAEMTAKGEAASLETVAADISARDARDAGRAVAPLRKAADAVELDTTGLSIDDQVERVVALIHERSGAAGSAAA